MNYPINMKSQIFKGILLLTIIPILFCGCQGIQSEVQKSEMLAAEPMATVDGVKLQLESSLHRTFYTDARRFDLKGQLIVVSTNGFLPEGIDIYHMALKPGWKGWPGYYVLNCKQKNGLWWMVNNGMNKEYSTFAGTSQKEKDRIIINFTWDDLGGLFGEKPEHFASYDVSVTMSDSQGKFYILTTPSVPTD